MINFNSTKQYYRNYLSAYLNLYRKNKSINQLPFKDIGLLNPSIGSANLGDLIIYDSIYNSLRDIFPNDLFTNYPTQLHTSYDAMAEMSKKDMLFVVGTNLLTSNLDISNQWKITTAHMRFIKGQVVLMGCGWWQYQGDINNFSKKIYKNILNKEVLHSVRDNYTLEKLKSIGIENVVNTTCPTLWGLTEDHCLQIPTQKKENVITTLTCYKKDADLDYKMLKTLSDNYENVYLWAQGLDDIIYYDSLNDGFKNINIIPPTLEAFDSALESIECDYIGSRLHAGVRALQKKRRTLILAVDNRAIEIGRDVNLNVEKRDCDYILVENFIQNTYNTKINLPIENIMLWKKSLFLK